MTKHTLLFCSPHSNANKAFSNLSAWESVIKKLSFCFTKSQCGQKPKKMRFQMYMN